MPDATILDLTRPDLWPTDPLAMPGVIEALGTAYVQVQVDWQVAHLMPYLERMARDGWDVMAACEEFAKYVQEQSEAIGEALGAEIDA